MHVIPQEGILVSAQLVEKVVYVDMKALEGIKDIGGVDSTWA